MALTLQLCAGAYGAPKTITVDSFHEFSDMLREPELTADKLTATTIMPVSLVDGATEKTVANVVAVTLLALDLDDVSEEQLLTLFTGPLKGKRWAAHTTFSHPDALAKGLGRWRVWLELARPVPASQWTAFRERFDATLATPVDERTRNANRLMFAPCVRDGELSSFESFDWRTFPGADTATPVDVPDDPSPRAFAITSAVGEGSSGTSTEPSEAIGLADLRKLRDKLRRRANKFDNTVGEYLAAVCRGEPYVTANSHEPTLDLARVLATELPDAAAWSLAALLGPSLALMRTQHGSDETERGFEEKVRSWRKKKAAEKARFALPAVFTGGGLAKPEPPESDDDEAAINFAPDAASALDKQFAVVTRPSGESVVFSVAAGDVCIRQSGDANQVRLVCNAVPFDSEGKVMSSRRARNAIDDWKAAVPRSMQEDPEPSRFKSEPGYCFQRLGFDPTPGPTPAWDEFTQRLSNAALFKAFMWTGFEKKHQGRQSLWLQGDGEDGKSSVMSVISDALGAAATAANVDTFTGRFGLSALDGKRFAIVFDCKDPKLLMKETLRNVTSGDEVLVERKGEALETKRLNVKVVVCSNYMPETTGSRADTSRLLLLTVDKSTNRDDPQWQTRLREELPAFLADCKATYERMCPHHGKLPLNESDRALLAERVDTSEEEFADEAGEIFEFTADAKDTASCGPVMKMLTSRGMTGRGWPMGKYRAWVEYLARRGVSTKRTAAGRVFTGVKSKTSRASAFTGK